MVELVLIAAAPGVAVCRSTIGSSRSRIVAVVNIGAALVVALAVAEVVIVVVVGVV